MDPGLSMLCACLISPTVTEYNSGHYVHSQEDDDSSNSGHYIQSQWDDGSSAHSNNGSMIHDSITQEADHWESSGHDPGWNNAYNNYNYNGVNIEDVESLGE